MTDTLPAVDPRRAALLVMEILAGISTSGVVLSTVRDAFDRDYQVFVLSDATADPVPGGHEFLTDRIFPRQAHVITTGDLKGLLSAPAPTG